jgi:calcyphosin
MTTPEGQSVKYRPRPRGTTLCSLAIHKGLLEPPQTAHPLMDEFRARLIQRGTDGLGFCELQRVMHLLDFEGAGILTCDEFGILLKKLNLSVDEEEASKLFALFDIYGYGYMNYEELIVASRGRLHPHRRELIANAWHSIDRGDKGAVDPEEVIERYNALLHPDVKTNFKNPQECFLDFLRAFEVGREISGKVSRIEFENYHYNLSASIERDEYFDDIMCSCWGLNEQYRDRHEEALPSPQLQLVRKMYHRPLLKSTEVLSKANIKEQNTSGDSIIEDQRYQPRPPSRIMLLPSSNRYHFDTSL